MAAPENTTRVEFLDTLFLPQFHKLWGEFKKKNNLSQNEEYYILSKYLSERASVQVSLDICRSWQLTEEELKQLEE